MGQSIISAHANVHLILFCITDGYDKLKPYGISIHGCIDG